MFQKHHNRTISILGCLLGISLLFVVDGLCVEKSSTIHHGYAGVDRLLECIHNNYDKIAVRDPSVRSLQFESCPQSREGLLALLRQYELRLYEAGNWIYVISSKYFNPMLPYTNAPWWTRVRILPRINPYKDEGFSEQEQNTISEQVFRNARMIPLYAPVYPYKYENKDDEIELKFDLKFCRTKLHPEDSDSVLLMMDQVIEQVLDRGSSLGRLIYGKIINGEFNILWDSRLFAGHADLHFEDVDSDGWQEIVVESVTGGVFPYPVWTIFDRNGREITRQKNCDYSVRPLNEDDGVCDLRGIDIGFSGNVHGPKDLILIEDKGKRTILKLQNGMYVPQPLKSAPPIRKGTRANP